jgi:hypothetical protein
MLEVSKKIKRINEPSNHEKTWKYLMNMTAGEKKNMPVLASFFIFPLLFYIGS